MTTPDKEEMPTEDRTVFVEVVGGRAGECLCINDRRVAGPKPWGGGAVVRRFEVPISELQLVMAALSTLPVNDRQTSDDAGRLRDDALANLKWEARFLLNRLSDLSFDDLDDLTRDFNGHVEPSISRLDRILSGMEARAALKGVPQPATNDYQADASAPALSETVSVRSEQKRRQKNMLTDLVDAVLYLNDIVGDLDETGKTSSTRLGHLQRAVDRLLESISSADTGAKLNFSNDAERDGGENA